MSIVDKILKYRIVGAAVLLSLAVIFIPMILDGAGQAPLTRIDMQIPAQPKIVFSDELQQQARLPAPDYAGTTSAGAAKSAAIDLQNNIVPEVIIKQSGSDVDLRSWIVQVGAFGDRQKALSLQKKLVKAGFDALVEVGVNQGEDYFRVKVGPLISQDEAAQIQDKLRKNLKLETAFVTRYPRSMFE